MNNVTSLSEFKRKKRARDPQKQALYGYVDKLRNAWNEV
jgi:hypothetical protein